MRNPNSENSIPEQAQEGPDAKTTRRQHLKDLAIGGASLVFSGLTNSEVAEAQDTQELKKKRLENDPYFLALDQNRISYDKEFKPITKDVEDFLSKFIERQNQISILLAESSARGVYDASDPKFQTEKRKLWDLLKQFLNHQSEYSQLDLNYVLAYDLPEKMAEFGVFIMPISGQAINEASNRIAYVEIAEGVYKIEQFTSQSLNEWGASFKRDILTVKPFPPGKDQKFFDRSESKLAGQSFFGNIILHPEFSKIGDLYQETNSGLVKQFQGLEEKDFLSSVSKSPDHRVQAGGLAILKVLRHYKLTDLATQEQKQLVEHETGHVFFDQTKYGQAFPVNAVKTASDYNIYIANFHTHSEIDAVLTEFRHQQSKAYSLLSIITYIQKGIQQDFYHDKAANWIVDRFVNIIKQSPKKYGMNVDTSSTVSAENQIILQLPDLLEKNDLFDEVVEKAMEVHQKNYGQDFSAEYYAYKGKPVPPGLTNVGLQETKYDLPKEFPWKETALGVGVAAAVGSAGLALRARQNKMQMVEAEKKLTKALRGIKGEKLDAKKLIKDLQLGRSKLELNEEERARALDELAKLGEKYQDIAGPAGFLRRKLVKKETKDSDAQKSK